MDCRFVLMNSGFLLVNFAGFKIPSHRARIAYCSTCFEALLHLKKKSGQVLLKSEALLFNVRQNSNEKRLYHSQCLSLLIYSESSPTSSALTCHSFLAASSSSAVSSGFFSLQSSKYKPVTPSNSSETAT